MFHATGDLQFNEQMMTYVYALLSEHRHMASFIIKYIRFTLCYYFESMLKASKLYHLYKKHTMKKQNRKQPKKKQQRNNQDGWNVPSNSITRIPKSPGVMFPDRTLTRLTYSGLATFTIPAAGDSFARRWTPTAAYDVDPLLGSTSTPGFAEFAGLYYYYRVVRSKLTARFANTSTTTPVQAIILPLNADPGATPSYATVASWLDNPYSNNKLLPIGGGPVISLSRAMSTEKLFGSKMVYFDDNFASLVTTTPSNNWYWAVAVISAAAVGSNQSVIVDIDIQMDVEFYSRKVLAA